MALLPSSGLLLTDRAHHPWTVLTGRRGRRNLPNVADVRDGSATVPHWTGISIGTAHCGLAIPWCHGFVTADVLEKGLSRGAIAMGYLEGVKADTGTQENLY